MIFNTPEYVIWFRFENSIEEKKIYINIGFRYYYYITILHLIHCLPLHNNKYYYYFLRLKVQ